MNMPSINRVQRFFVRAAIILFWCFVCILFLWMPTFIGYWIPKKPHINVLTWPLVIDLRRVAEFEKETGVKVLVNYYEKNEELFTKLTVNKGRGYDLIITTDFSVEQLSQQQLLKPLDRAALDFWQYLRPGVLGHYFDPHNIYSVPYFVSMYGLGIDSTAFESMPEASWSLIFEQGLSPAPIGMIEDMREAIFIAGQYLYGTADLAHRSNWQPEIASLLKRQKEWVYLYTDARVEDLLTSRSVPVSVAMSVDIWKIKKEYPEFDFLLPKEGGFLVMESCVIPASTSNDELVYKFINYLFKPEVVKHHVQLYGVCPSINNVDVTMPSSLCVSDEQMRSIPFFRNTISKEMVNKTRIEVMAS